MKIEELHDILYDMICAIDDACKAEGVPYFLAGGSMLGAVRHNGFIPWDDDADLFVKYEDYSLIKAALQKHLPPYYRLLEPCEFEPYFYDFILRVQDMRYHWREPGEEDLRYDNKQNYICVDIFTACGCANSFVGAKLYGFVHKIIYGLAMGHRVSYNAKKYSFIQRIQTVVLSSIGKLITMSTINRMYSWLCRRYLGKDKKYAVMSNDNPHYIDLPLETVWFAEPVDMPFRDRKFPIPKGFDEQLTATYGDYMQPPKDRSIYIKHMDCE